MVDDEGNLEGFKPSSLKEFFGVAIVKLITKRFLLALTLLLITAAFGVLVIMKTEPSTVQVAVFSFFSGVCSTVIMFYFGDTNKPQTSTLFPAASSCWQSGSQEPVQGVAKVETTEGAGPS